MIIYGWAYQECRCQGDGTTLQTGAPAPRPDTDGCGQRAGYDSADDPQDWEGWKYPVTDVSLEGLLGKNFDIDDESLFSKDYALNSIVKAKLNEIRDEYLDKLKEAEKGFMEQMDAAADLL